MRSSPLKSARSRIKHFGLSGISIFFFDFYFRFSKIVIILPGMVIMAVRLSIIFNIDVFVLNF